MATDTAQRRVMVIGLDAATMALVRLFAAEGRLPHLSRFLDRGAAGLLRSTLPILSSAAWSTFATGTNPGQHGVTDFRLLAADSYEPRFCNALNRRGATLWEIAGRQGVRGGVINVPITYPPQPYDGFIISGMLTPGVGPRMASPPQIYHDLMAVSPNYAIEVEITDARGQDLRELYLDRAPAVVEARKRAAIGLYRKHRPPLFIVVFTLADRICHYFWSFHERARAGKARTTRQERLGEAIGMIYEKLDEAVGALMAEAGDGTDVLVLSDHGAGPVRANVNVRKILADAGLLAEVRPALRQRLARRAHECFRRAVPISLRQRVAYVLPRLSRRAVTAAIFSGVDFSRTQAYPSGLSAGVFVNLRGRQPRGVVEPGRDYEAVRDRIIRLFADLTNPQTGKRVFGNVHRREEIASGPCVTAMPDVIMEQGDEIYRTPQPCPADADGYLFRTPDSAPRRLSSTGSHRRDGLLMALGPHVRKTEIAGAHIIDVAPTILALLGCAVPEHFEGRALTEILADLPASDGGAAAPPGAPGSHAAGTAGGQEVFSDSEQQVIEERLKGLGYV